MSRKHEDHNSGFAELIDALAAKAGLSSDRAIAKEAFLNNALVSRLRRQKGGIDKKTKSTEKSAILLGWGLNSSPITLASDIRSFLIASGAGKQEYKKSISDVLAEYSEGATVWAYIPDATGFSELYDELKLVSTEAPIKIFTGIDNARIVWGEQAHEVDSDQPPSRAKNSASLSKQIDVTTPNELILNRDTSLIILNPTMPGTRKIYAWFPRPSAHLSSNLIKLPETEILHRFVYQLSTESASWSLYRLALEEKEHGKKNNAVILLYADYFPEADDHVESRCLYNNIKSNLINKTRYLYINPYPKISTESRRVDISFQKLKQKLLADESVGPDLLGVKNFDIRSVSQEYFYRQATFIIYGHTYSMGSDNSRCELAKSRILKQCDGQPLRFAPLDSTATAHLELTFLDGLMASIDDWLQLGAKA